MNSNHLSCSSWIVAQEMVGIMAGGVLSGYVHTFAFFFFFKCYRSREKSRAFMALGEVESKSRKFCFIKETFEMS